MASTDLYGAVGGFSQGAAAGSVFGVWGAAVGGIVGGAMGISMAGKARKAKKYQQKAQAVQMEREQNAVDARYLQMLREARFNRAGSLQAGINSGISTSSLTTSALSSIGSQAQYNIQYLANDRRLFNLYSNYMQRAGANLNTYQDTMTFLKNAPDITAGIATIAGAFTDSNTPQPWEYSRAAVQNQGA